MGSRLKKPLRMFLGTEKCFPFKFGAILTTKEGKEEQTHKAPRRAKGATWGEDREAENRTPSESAGASAGHDRGRDHQREETRTGDERPCVVRAS